jgi:hypothetical protein
MRARRITGPSHLFTQQAKRRGESREYRANIDRSIMKNLPRRSWISSLEACGQSQAEPRRESELSDEEENGVVNSFATKRDHIKRAIVR